MTRGLLYIATGEPFVREAVISAKRAKNVMNDYPIAIITDIDLDANVNIDKHVFDHIIEINNAEQNSGDQIKYMDKSPFDRTIFLDTDIYIHSDISDLFDVLDQFDIAASLSPTGKNQRVDPDLPDAYPEYNTGVVVFQNNKKIGRFLSKWEETYRRDKTQQNWPNQPSFRETVFHSDLRIATIPPEYHLLIRQPGYVKGEVKAAHGRLLEVGHLSGGGRKNLDVPSAVEKLNQSEHGRVYTLGLRNIRVHSNSKLYILKNSLKIYGTKKTIKLALGKIKRMINKIR